MNFVAYRCNLKFEIIRVQDLKPKEKNKVHRIIDFDNWTEHIQSEFASFYIWKTDKYINFRDVCGKWKL